MHEAVIHIGTEKTGSTAIQNFLYKNEAQLAAGNVCFPYKSLGLISNFRLVLYAQSTPSPQFVKQELKNFQNDISSEDLFKKWKVDFAKEHKNHLKKFQKNKQNSLVVYSSEHFHSRLVEENDVMSLKELLADCFDRIRVVFYVRRQDRLALSSHNTQIQSGFDKEFSFSPKAHQGYYYNYFLLAERWSNAFGKSNVDPKIFEPERLTDRDVVKDFEQYLDVKSRISSDANLQYEKSNERLSYSALATLVEFNKLDAMDARLKGMSKESMRQKIISIMHGLDDEHGEVLPLRSSAEAFYAAFSDSNNAFFNTWLDGNGFNPDFSKYPDSDTELPVIDTDALLDQVLDEYHKKKVLQSKVLRKQPLAKLNKIRNRFVSAL